MTLPPHLLKVGAARGGGAFPLVCRRALALIIDPDTETVWGGSPCRGNQDNGGWQVSGLLVIELLQGGGNDKQLKVMGGGAVWSRGSRVTSNISN